MIDELPNLPEEFFTQPEEVIDPFYLDLDDQTLVKTCKDNIENSIAFYQKRDLYKRQEKNVEYYLGKQALYKASNKAKPYKENIIFEGISRIKPIALSKMPDLTVKPGDESPESKQTAEKLSGIFNSDIKKRANRKLLGLETKLEPLYFYAVIKAIWNPEKGMFGDYEFVHVHPTNIVFDHYPYDNSADKMRFVAEKARLPLKEVIMMFPDKEEEIKKYFGWADNVEDSDEKKLASPVNIWEIWFHWYKLKPNKEIEKIDGVIWIYKDLLLKKMRNPYFDYQGKTKVFSKVLEEKDAYTMDDIFDMIDQSGDQSSEDVVYNNYFQEPRKPYFFMVYENLGQHPIGETSRVEQVLEFQDFINQDGSVVADMNIRSRGKDLIDTNAISQKTLDKVNIYDVDQVLGLDVPSGQSIQNVHSRIEQKPATPQQYKSMAENRQKGFEMLGVGQPLRGIVDPDATLGQEQMGREGDFSLNDDVVEDTINACAEWQSQWALQFIKLFYTKPHMRHVLGKDGEVLHTKLTRDMVDDGMEVVVSASGVDKMMRRRMAMENAKIGYGNPLDYFIDTEQSQPKERALRSMLFNVAPQMYIQKYLMNDQLGPDNPPMPGMEALGQQTPPMPPGNQVAPQAGMV